MCAPPSTGATFGHSRIGRRHAETRWQLQLATDKQSFLFDMTLMAILFFFALTQTEIDHKHIHKQAEKKHAMPPSPLAPCPPSFPYRDTFVWGHIHIRTH